jgi:hypothetical protein
MKFLKDGQLQYIINVLQNGVTAPRTIKGTWKQSGNDVLTCESAGSKKQSKDATALRRRSFTIAATSIVKDTIRAPKAPAEVIKALNCSCNREGHAASRGMYAPCTRTIYRSPFIIPSSRCKQSIVISPASTRCTT